MAHPEGFEPQPSDASMTLLCRVKWASLRSVEASRLRRRWVAAAAWIDDYNTDRRHSALCLLTPITFEQTGIPIQHDRAVLAGVKAKPFGWPAASPDPGSGGTDRP
jgi:hypothetical protein